MSYWKIAWRSMQQRALASTLTGLSMALGVAVTIGVIVVHSVAVRQFEQDAQGYNYIVGGKGGALPLVLQTVYHLGRDKLYPIPYSYYEEFVTGKFAEVTDVAVPYCLGDTFETPNGKLFRVIGTTPALFDQIKYGTDRQGNPIGYEFRYGRNFKEDHFFEAVLGSVVAAQSGLEVGDMLHPTHGLSGEGEKHREFLIVGILEPTGTANDRAAFVNIEGFYLLDGHAMPPKENDPSDARELPMGVDAAGEPVAPLPISQREVTSILVRCDSYGTLVLENGINKGEGSVAQAVAPTREVTLLLDQIVGPVRIVLLVLTVLIVIVAGISILVSIYNSMSERSYDIAVMRALGASRSAVMWIILSESLLLSLCGGLAGIVLGHGMIALVSPLVEARTGITLSPFDVDPQELYLIPALVVLASLVGFLPAITAYRTDVAKTLGGAR